ncbi:MAG TPA: DUF6496 domain-containing protein [Chitinophaga sp.]|uniref:DUF6496 domain-containing protein n=1 Tax=Chitinophaga sp. TaxID=1869181 RepID=UPI002C2662FC|nr:DUF6496 domain-containing protein [Chitinophaga sp.]HVI43454.1 DUF6496 domain-containing protein [Chitinophaga sp.]
MAKYSRKAQEKVEKSMHEMHEGKLRSGRNGKKVTNPKQAIAIGLSEAREAGAKVPKKAAARKSATRKSTTKKAAAKRATTKRATARKATPKKATTRKAVAKDTARKPAAKKSPARKKTAKPIRAAAHA